MQLNISSCCVLFCLSWLSAFGWLTSFLALEGRSQGVHSCFIGICWALQCHGHRSAWICWARACCKRGTQDRKVWQEDVTKDHLIGLYNLDPRHPKSFAYEFACLLDSFAVPTWCFQRYNLSSGFVLFDQTGSQDLKRQANCKRQ